MSTIEELFAAAIQTRPGSVSENLRRPARTGAIRIVNQQIDEQRAAGEIPNDMATVWLMHDRQSEGDDVFPEFAFLPIVQAISEYSELCYTVLFPIGWTPGGSDCLSGP